jgi:broad specificity phosphatase PhoE
MEFENVQQKKPARRRTKKVHFIRHAEGEHNVAGQVPGGYLREEFVDAILTELGQQQCMQLHRHLVSDDADNLVDAVVTNGGEHHGASSRKHNYRVKHHLADVDLLVTSPLRRTLQTATLSFKHLQSIVPWIALESIRETTGQHPCDRRLPTSHHKENFPHVNFEHITEENDVIYPLYTTSREPAEDVAKRAIDFLSWLSNREEHSIIVVTHSAFLRVLFRHVFGMSAEEFRGFNNCEVRSCLMHFIDDSVPIIEHLR